MLLWFVATSVLAVRAVFQDARFDYRLLIAGSLLPAAIDVPADHARWAHSLTVAVALLIVVMLVSGRRPIRRLLLGIPIGMMLHLVFDGAFSVNRVFWWPFLGSWGEHRAPELARGWWSLALEALGAVGCAYAWRTFGLSDPRRRRAFAHDGVLVPVQR